MPVIAPLFEYVPGLLVETHESLLRLLNAFQLYEVPLSEVDSTFQFTPLFDQLVEVRPVRFGGRLGPYVPERKVPVTLSMRFTTSWPVLLL